MVKIVKPNLTDIKKSFDIKKYDYNNTLSKIKEIKPFEHLTNAINNNYNFSNDGSLTDKSSDGLLQDGKLQSLFEQFNIFDDLDGEKESNVKEKLSSKPYGNLDMNNYPDGQYNREAAKERSVLVAKYLVQNGGFTKEQAAAMVGVYWDENGCYPGEIMQAEKRQNANSYGAGIGSWTSQSYKNRCLNDAGLPANTPIESLTMQQQCDMIIAMSQKSDKKYFDALKRCETIEDASATAVIITGGVGFSNNWSTHPTAAEAKELSDWYGSRNDKKYGYSKYHHDLDKRRLDYAKEILAEL